MKILYSTTSYPPAVGGAQIHMHSLATNMINLGNDVRVVTQWSKNRNDWLWGTTFFAPKKKDFNFDSVSVFQIGLSLQTRIQIIPWIFAYYLNMESSVKNISAYMMPYIEKLKFNPNIVHATRIGREFIAKTSYNFARKHDIPFVLTPNHHPRWHGHLYREYDKLYREADALIALTEAEKQMLVTQKKVSDEKIHITGIGPILSSEYSEEKFRSKYLIKDKYVLFLGQQYEYKGVKAILEAAKIVWKKYPCVSFVFIGPKTRYSKILFSLVRDKRITNLGIVDLETKTSAIAGCEFLCVPSSQESFGGVYVEAWSFGKAVIGGRIPAISCVIDDGQDGLLSSQDAYELSEAILYLLLHPNICVAMGEVGQKKVEEKYTWNRITRKTMSVYKKLLS